MLPEEMEGKITKKTKAVIFVDALGSPTGIHEIKKICQKHNISTHRRRLHVQLEAVKIALNVEI